MSCHLQISVTDQSSIGEVRRAVGVLAEQMKLGETDAGRASIVATELATNLVRHSTRKSGSIVMGHLGADALDVLSLDYGPGISDVARCFADGYSTGGTPGNGLGAVRRLSDECDVSTSPISGTAVWCRVYRDKTVPVVGTHRTGAIALPAVLETVCGDHWRIRQSDDGALALMIADGLGHGPLASEASNAACRVFDENPFGDGEVLIEKMHSGINGTRGAAVAVAHVNPSNCEVRFTGVGNISGTLIEANGATHGLFSHNGTVGHSLRKVQVFEYPWSSTSTLIMHSDGLQTRWSLAGYPGLNRRAPVVIAGVLMRDFRRGRDDASVVVVSPTV